VVRVPTSYPESQRFESRAVISLNFSLVFSRGRGQKPEWQLNLPKHSGYYMHHLQQNCKTVYFIKLFMGFILSRVGGGGVLLLKYKTNQNVRIWQFIVSE
jgi:hypothetical protein